MSKTSAESLQDSANELLDRWLAHHRPQVDGATTVEPAEPVAAAAAVTVLAAGAEPVPEPALAAVRPVVEPEQIAHPALGGAAAAPSALGPEIAEATADLHAAASLPPEPTGVSAPTGRPERPAPVRRPPNAPARPPGLVLFSPRRGARRALTAVAVLLAAGASMAGYRAWQSQEPTDIGVAGGLLVALLLAWTLRKHTHGAVVSIENGVLRVVQGKSRHLFPLAGTHPPISILGEPRDRRWKVLIQRRGMPPFVVNRRMVEPGAFTEAIRHFRPEA